MRDEERADQQRARRKALYDRFAARQQNPVAKASSPELSGLGYYHLDGQDAAHDPAASPAEPAADAQPQTQFLPQVESADHEQSEPHPEHDAFAPLEYEHEHEADAEQASHLKQHRKRSKRKRNLVMVAVVLIFALVVGGSIFTVQSLVKQFNPDDYAGPGGATVEFTVEDGWGVKVISRKLEDADIVADDKLFSQAVEDSTASSKVIHPGTYLLRQQMPAADAADELINNRPDKVFYVALKSNLRLPAALQEIADGSGLKIDELTKLANDPKKFGLPAEVKNLEGWLHPGEYRFALDSSAQDVLKTLVDATKKSLQDAGQKDLSKGYRALKIASIMQAEATPNDYATVAGAIENRLHPSNKETGGRLEVDSSVIYGLGRYTLQFSSDERRDKANAYNTYVHPGLPPTPIGSPSGDAIKAAVNPESNNYYYWVTVNTQTGETKFASTYAEHQKNQAQFRTWCEQNADVCK
ncbi:endolytic transglycosylase MltG [Glutamicibacter sp.]|uniref:endolytic transglycosylase MltG n=1 Tax=Glutamicibacter sp. TaxID=1931995 RepID=UPI0028BDC696|nr:endolytic transglycosylase MltG [Glutamicibacter sp.]